MPAALSPLPVEEIQSAARKQAGNSGKWHASAALDKVGPESLTNGSALTTPDEATGGTAAARDGHTAQWPQVGRESQTSHLWVDPSKECAPCGQMPLAPWGMSCMAGACGPKSAPMPLPCMAAAGSSCAQPMESCVKGAPSAPAAFQGRTACGACVPTTPACFDQCASKPAGIEGGTARPQDAACFLAPQCLPLVTGAASPLQQQSAVFEEGHRIGSFNDAVNATPEPVAEASHQTLSAPPAPPSGRPVQSSPSDSPPQQPASPQLQPSSEHWFRQRHAWAFKRAAQRSTPSQTLDPALAGVRHWTRAMLPLPWATLQLPTDLTFGVELELLVARCVGACMHMCMQALAARHPPCDAMMCCHAVSGSVLAEK